MLKYIKYYIPAITGIAIVQRERSGFSKNSLRRDSFCSATIALSQWSIIVILLVLQLLFYQCFKFFSISFTFIHLLSSDDCNISSCSFSNDTRSNSSSIFFNCFISFIKVNEINCYW